MKRLERVKGIEPSYSAWKAAALPLSYTRVRGSLTRPRGGLNCPRSTTQEVASRRLSGPSAQARFRLARLPLTAAALRPILESPETNERR